MKGFKNTTRMVSGHTHVPASEFHTFGKSNPGHRLAHGGPVDHVSGLHEKGGVADFHEYGADHAAVLRKVPSTEELAEHGGKTPLTAGYKKGGHHFHVHKHYHSGGKVMTKTKSYRKHEKEAERRATGGLIDKDTSGHTGDTRDKLKKGGAFGHIKKGALHKDMGIPQGEKIPRGKIRSKLSRDKAHHNVKGIRRDTFALNMGKAKGGHIFKSHETPPDYATGGTIDKMGAGGALYSKGGRK